MLEIDAVEVIGGRTVNLRLSDGSTVARDLTDLLQGPLLGQLATDDTLFLAARVEHGTLAWPGDIDIAPETLIWDGPDPARDEVRPKPFLKPRSPAA